MGFLIQVPRTTIPVDRHNNQVIGSAGQGQVTPQLVPLCPIRYLPAGSLGPEQKGKDSAGLFEPSLSFQTFQSC